MSHEAARNAIQAHVAANWTAAPVAYDNAVFAKPNEAPWARLSILNSFGGGVSMGTPRRYRFAGIVVFGIFVPEETGPSLATLLADQGIALFEAQRLSGGVVFENVFAQEQGNDPEGPWFRIDVLANYRFDVVR